MAPELEPGSTPGAGSARHRSTKLALAALAVLVAVVLWGRTRSLDYLLPHLVEPDAYAVRQAEFFRAKAAGDAEAPPFHFYFYPMLLARLQLAFPPTGIADPEPEDDELSEHLAAAGAPVERARWIVAVLSVLTVPATWLLARRFLTPAGALLAAAFVGTSLLHLQFSGQARPHGMAVSFIALALASSLYLARAPSLASYAIAGVANMLALCSLQNGSAALLALVAAHLVRDRQRERGSRWKVLVPIAVIAAGVSFFYAFFVEAAEESSQQSYTSLSLEGGVLTYGGHSIDLNLFRGAGFARMGRLMAEYDPALLAASAIGLVALLLAAPAYRRRSDPAAAKRRRDLIVIGAHAAPYFFVLGLYGRTVDRYLLPLLPCFAILASFGLIRLSSLAARVPRIALATLAVVALALPVQAAWHLIEIRGRMDTETQAARWIDASLEPVSTRIVLGPGVVLPLFYAGASLARNVELRKATRWLDYLKALPEERRGARRFDMPEELFRDPATRDRLRTIEGARTFVDELDADYVVLEVSQRPRAIGPHFERFRDAVREAGVLAVRCSPRPKLKANLPYLDYQGSPQMRRRTLSADFLGPTVEIWRLTDEAPRR